MLCAIVPAAYAAPPVRQAPALPAWEGDACLVAIAAAEAKYKTLPGLLLAIARTESGRVDNRTGSVQPWPWATNVAGTSAYFDSKADTIANIANAQQRGTKSIDVGCLQVNLQQHPAAFATLDEALDPGHNADYAARFLVQLHAETGDWQVATGFYHSRTPEYEIPYQLAVAERMGKPTPPPRPVAPQQVLREKMKAAWAATIPVDAASQSVGWSEQPLQLYATRQAPSLKSEPSAAGRHHT